VHMKPCMHVVRERKREKEEKEGKEKKRKKKTKKKKKKKKNEKNRSFKCGVRVLKKEWKKKAKWKGEGIERKTTHATRRCAFCASWSISRLRGENKEESVAQ
jgi:hypothetical protein